MRIGIVGAGMAGLSCAARLAEAGAAVSLFDKGRGAGGRLSTRRAETRLGPLRFDHGAQYLTARDEDFRRQVADWRRDGIVAPWPAAGDDAWVGVPGMNAPARALAAGRDIALACRVDGIARGDGGWRLAGADGDAGTFERVVVALPAEQAATLLRPVAPDMAALAAATPSDPCWTVMAGFAEALAIAGDVVKRAGPIGWAARDSAKPGRGGPECWVVQASPDWSRRHLEEAPEAVLPLLLAALGDVAGAPPAGTGPCRGPSLALRALRDARPGLPVGGRARARGLRGLAARSPRRGRVAVRPAARRRHAGGRDVSLRSVPVLDGQSRSGWRW